MKDEERELQQVEKDIQVVVEKMLEKLSTVQLGDLSGEITDIEEPACEKEVYPIYFDRTEKDNSKWLALLKEALKTAKTFEIHCWNGEEEWIDVALRYGKLKESDWTYGKMITGEVTPEFSDMLLTMPKPENVDIHTKMTPFFNVFLDSGFQSSHYGTEVCIY